MSPKLLFNAYLEANDRDQFKRALNFLLSSFNLNESTYNFTLISHDNKIIHGEHLKILGILIDIKKQCIALKTSKIYHMNIIQFDDSHNVFFIQNEKVNNTKAFFPSDRKTATLYKRLLQGPVELILRDYLCEKGLDHQILENYRKLIDNYSPSKEFKELC